MALNIKKILEQVGMDTIEEFVGDFNDSEDQHTTAEDINAYASGKKKIDSTLLSSLANYTGLTMEEINDQRPHTSEEYKYNVTDTFAPSQEAKDNLEQYLEEGIKHFDVEEIRIEIKQLKMSVDFWGKPKISFAGQSDTGKSTLINAIIGSEKMPAKWTPTTSIIVYIKHIDDRPAFIKDDVWFFGKNGDELWDERKLNDEKYCRDFYVVGGDYSLLETYGTHQGEKEDLEAHSAVAEAYSAVAFVDSPILVDCDIVDVPGIAANKKDDILHKQGTDLSDILVYLSRSNGFLQDQDFVNLFHCLNSLRPVESSTNGVDKLENLFIIAAQAGAVNRGNVKDLRDIMNIQCNKMCNILAKSARDTYDSASTLLPSRTKITGLNYNQDDFRKRFFTYERDMDRLCKDFRRSFKQVIEKLPKSYHKDMCNNLCELKSNAESSLNRSIKEYTRMVNEKEEYIKFAREIEAKEPARKLEQTQRKRELLDDIDVLNSESKQEIQKFYEGYMNVDNLVSEIEHNGVKNKKDSKQDFVSLVGKVISDRMQKIMDDETDKYTKKLEDFLDNYTASLNQTGKVEGIDIEFDTSNAFAMGITAAGAVGASAAWLATSFTASIVTLFPELASIGMFAAFGGAIVIAIGGVVAGIIAIFKAATWKKSLAKSVVDQYEKAGFLNKIYSKVDDYWADTKKGLEAGVDSIEKEWQKKLSEIRSLADESKVSELSSKVSSLQEGVSYFEKMPMPEEA